MESLAKLHQRQQPLHLSLYDRRPSFSRPISSFSFRTSSSSSTSKSLFIRASSSPSSFSRHSPTQDHQSPKSPFFETLLPHFFKASCIAIAAAAVFFARFNVKPVIAAPAATVEPFKQSTMDSVSDEEKERTVEEYVESHPDDVEGLKSLMEVKIKNRKLQEAVGVIERLIQLEPDDKEWPLLKAHLYSYSGESELAKLGFEEILSANPLTVEAYHGLVMAVSQSDSGDELNQVLKRIEAAMERCKKEKKKEDLRDFKLLVAQIRVIEGKYNDALKVYQELVKEEPRDFRPYLCQGIIYTLLRKKDEAEKQFQKYRRLVPKGHPYARYFDDNMIATRMEGYQSSLDGSDSNFNFNDDCDDGA
ncbi:hypothetical protein PVL29_010173 [Vitis rotundifolia]|uniref:Chloroplast lumen common family protein n=1 Tax=Vitis rotundifolia TaxID=103349 RepID=A0AA38ZSM5_VITRO|nr:hypothetical protein PVL29_010173 [Vitis rotundifolia]